MKWTKYEKILAICFLLSLPLVKPWIHGDGRGYYAFARAILFQQNLDFELDWYHGYEHDPRVSDPAFRSLYLTPNGHFWNHWTIGPAILWSPFLVAARVIAPVVDHLRGTHLANDGFSAPYMVAKAIGTAFYGFLALWISFRWDCKYTSERWAFLGTVAIWLASSFAYYLYFDPSFPHVHSAFLIALFAWLWDRTRNSRTPWQWFTLGVLAGLMMDTYYPNVFVLILPAVESIRAYRVNWRARAWDETARLAANNLLFGAASLLVFFPTLLTKKILWGSYFQAGYREAWYWYSPAFFRVCFSSHGAFSWTPILVCGVVGLSVATSRSSPRLYLAGPAHSVCLLHRLLCGMARHSVFRESLLCFVHSVIRFGCQRGNEGARSSVEREPLGLASLCQRSRCAGALELWVDLPVFGPSLPTRGEGFLVPNRIQPSSRGAWTGGANDPNISRTEAARGTE